MDISTRIQNLTIEKRILLSHRLKKELVSQSVDSKKTSSRTDLEIPWETTKRPNPRLRIDRQHEVFSTLQTNQEKRTRLVAYLVLTADHTLMNHSTDSDHPSRSTSRRDVKWNEQGKDVVLSELRNFLSERLPDFMIPSVFMVLEGLPRTNTGKVDYQTLPHPPVSDNRFDRHSDSPTTATQKQLQKIWAAALGTNQIGICENFFTLGGHSLLIAQVVSQIRSTIGVDIALRSLFDYPTIETLSEAIDTLRWTKKERVHSSEDTPSDREKFEI